MAQEWKVFREGSAEPKSFKAGFFELHGLAESVWGKGHLADSSGRILGASAAVTSEDGPLTWHPSSAQAPSLPVSAAVSGGSGTAGPNRVDAVFKAVCAVCAVGLTATVVDLSNFTKDYNARHDPTFKAAVSTVGACTRVLTAAGQGTDQVVKFFVPIAATMTAIKTLVSHGRPKDRPPQQTSTTTATTAGSPGTSSGAASASHSNSSTV